MVRPPALCSLKRRFLFRPSEALFVASLNWEFCASYCVFGCVRQDARDGAENLTMYHRHAWTGVKQVSSGARDATSGR